MLQKTELPAGKHVYPFRFEIPRNVPSTHTLDKGDIKYKCVATVKRPWSLNTTATKEFVVVNQLDLNKFGSTSEILTIGKHDSFKGKPFFMLASIAKIIIAGQSTDLRIKINNQSDVDIMAFKVTLKRKVKYSTKGQCCYESEEFNDENVWDKSFDIPNDQKNPVVLKVVVPQDIVPTETDSISNVIKYSYNLRVSAVPSGMRTNVHLDTPIIITDFNEYYLFL